MAELRVLFGERRRESVEESENIVADQHLAIAVRSAAPILMVGIFSCEVTASATVSGIASSTIANAPRIFESERVEDQFLGGRFTAGLLAHSAKAMHVLKE